MDVRCDRCGTEYEFDDALVSERGTSVKCTSCGYQFKVFRPRAATVSSPEHWVVRTGDGRELVFHALRELQKAILAGQLDRGDMLSRGGGPMRGLGTIPELLPFFDEAAKGASQSRARYATPAGIGGPSVAAAPAPVPVPVPIPPPAPPPGPPRMGATTLQGVPHLPSPSVDPRSVPVQSTFEIEPPTTRHVSSSAPAPAPMPSPSIDASAGARGPSGYETPQPPGLDGSGRHSMFDEPTSLGGGRSGATRWIVAVVLLGTLAALGGTVGRQAIQQAVRPAASGEAPDARVKDLLVQGDRAMADGDLEGAKELLIKASAHAENDGRVLVSLARLSAMQADVAWLKLRLLPEGSREARLVAKKELEDGAARAKKAAERAAEVSPDDPAAARVKVDALRLIDDRGPARALAPRLSAGTVQPEAAYVLAALDLSEPQPPWKTIIERLQLAATAETSPGRARAALVYALARSGDGAAAKAELERMVVSSRPYPLLAELKAFVGEASPAGSASAQPSASAPASAPDAGVRDAGPDVAPRAAVDIGSLPTAAQPVAAGGAPAPKEQETPGGEFSEEELHKKLFGDKAPAKDKDEVKHAPPPKKAGKPDIDTSDLPGVTPP